MKIHLSIFISNDLFFIERARSPPIFHAKSYYSNFSCPLEHKRKRISRSHRLLRRESERNPRFFRFVRRVYPWISLCHYRHRQESWLRIAISPSILDHETNVSASKSLYIQPRKFDCAWHTERKSEG